ncbi:hypothetical protein ACSZNO_17540 [Aeromonas veronii]
MKKSKRFPSISTLKKNKPNDDQKNRTSINQNAMLPPENNLYSLFLQRVRKIKAIAATIDGSVILKK